MVNGSVSCREASKADLPAVLRLYAQSELDDGKRLFSSYFSSASTINPKLTPLSTVVHGAGTEQDVPSPSSQHYCPDGSRPSIVGVRVGAVSLCGALHQCMRQRLVDDETTEAVTSDHELSLLGISFHSLPTVPIILQTRQKLQDPPRPTRAAVSFRLQKERLLRTPSKGRPRQPM